MAIINNDLRCIKSTVAFNRAMMFIRHERMGNIQDNKEINWKTYSTSH